jgi:hypothetical protein
MGNDKMTLETAINDLEDTWRAVFGFDAGSEPDIYQDFDRTYDYQKKMRLAIEYLKDLNTIRKDES